MHVVLVLVNYVLTLKKLLYQKRKATNVNEYVYHCLKKKKKCNRKLESILMFCLFSFPFILNEIPIYIHSDLFDKNLSAG